MSVVASHRIVSPPAEELISGCMCKVRGLERNPAKVIGCGTYSDMNKKLNEMEVEVDTDEASPPKKKTRLDVGKENRTPAKRGRKPQKKTNKKRGNFL